MSTIRINRMGGGARRTAGDCSVAGRWWRRTTADPGNGERLSGDCTAGMRGVRVRRAIARARGRRRPRVRQRGCAKPRTCTVGDRGLRLLRATTRAARSGGDPLLLRQTVICNVASCTHRRLGRAADASATGRVTPGSVVRQPTAAWCRAARMERRGLRVSTPRISAATNGLDLRGADICAPVDVHAGRGRLRLPRPVTNASASFAVLRRRRPLPGRVDCPAGAPRGAPATPTVAADSTAAARRSPAMRACASPTRAFRETPAAPAEMAPIVTSPRTSATAATASRRRAFRAR